MSSDPVAHLAVQDGVTVKVRSMAEALAKRVLEYVGEEEISPQMDCDRELQTLARQMLAELAK